MTKLVKFHKEHKKLVTVTAVKPSGRFGALEIQDSTNHVKKFKEKPKEAISWMNGGFFIFDYRIFDYILKDEDFVDEPFMRLIEEGQLRTLRFAGFWACMDTFKERVLLEDLIADGPAPWEIWAMPGRREQDPIAAAHGDPEETPKERAGLSRSEGH